MRHAEPQPAAPLRILFILASVEQGDEAAQIAALARLLDPHLYRIEVISCLGAPQPLTACLALSAAAVATDTAPHDMDFDTTVAYLADLMSRHDILVAAQNVADAYPALDRLHLQPPLIEWCRTAGAAGIGPKHHTRACVLPPAAAGGTAAGRTMVEIPPLTQGQAGPPRAWPLRALPHQGPGDAAQLWQALFDRLARDRPPAPPPDLFRSFWQGGFECSTHRLRSGQRLDMASQIGHDRFAAEDYRQVAGHGMLTLRDGLRWHLIEAVPGQFDFASFAPMLNAAQRSGTQVIWDLLHFGWPDGLDIWSPAFVSRFARFAAAAGRYRHDHSDDIPFWCPVNEISFLSWGAGDVGYLNPFARGRGFELKVQLARASIAAIEELRAIDPRARFVQCEPAIAIHPLPGGPCSRAEAEDANRQQFQALDLLSGRLWPQIGGRPEFLDVLGLNYYVHNQWLHGGESIDLDHPRYRPLSDLLFGTHARYGRPVMIAETGIEGDRRPAWLAYVAREVACARARGVPVEGICLYPVVDHPGWDDGRDCPNGLLGQDPRPQGRDINAPLAEALLLLQRQNPAWSRPDLAASARLSEPQRQTGA